MQGGEGEGGGVGHSVDMCKEMLTVMRTFTSAAHTCNQSQYACQSIKDKAACY